MASNYYHRTLSELNKSNKRHKGVKFNPHKLRVKGCTHYACLRDLRYIENKKMSALKNSEKFANHYKLTA